MVKECFEMLRTEKSEYAGPFRWDAAGMSFLIRTKENRLIAIDGGETYRDACHLIEKASELSGEPVPTIFLWIITHFHNDHYMALEEISESEELKSRIRIKSLCCQLPPWNILPGSGVSIEKDLERVKKIIALLGIDVIVPHTGDVLNYDGLSVRFFFTPEDLQNQKDPNELSLIFRVSGTRKSLMITGDSYERQCRVTAYRFWNELASDYCQAAHHGLNGGAPEFYARVNAPTLLIPTSLSGDRDISSWEPGSCPRHFAERIAEKVYKSYEGDRLFDL